MLTQSDYELVVDREKSREQRLEAFNRRASWYRILGDNYLDQLANMIERFGDLGVVGLRPGVAKDPDFPAEMYVESRPFAPGAAPKGETLAASKDADAKKRHALADEAEQIPRNRGRWVGRVGRAARSR